MIRLTARALLSFALASLGALSARTFVIEAEDFDHDAGQHPPIVDEMPYYGGALGQYSAISGIDYDFPDSRPTPDMYRYYETPNVPIRGAWSTLSRGAWDVVENFRLSRFTPSSGAWFNYTRVIPAGRYRVYAALSWGDSTPNAVGGQFALVTSGLGTPNQTLATLGDFLGDGSGNWEAIRRVPLREGGLPKVVDLDGTSTFRYAATAGDLDYLMFVPETMPGAEIIPSFASIPVGGSVTLTAQAVGSGPLSYQWLRDGIDLPGANQSTLEIASATGSTGGRYSVRVTNPYGTWESDPTEVRVYFPIQLGDLVAPNVPYPSAGILQGLGQIELYEYRFEAQAGQAIRIDRLSNTDCNEVRFRLSGPGQEGYFGDLNGQCGGAGGTLILQGTGTYTITIEAYAWSGINEYSFRLSVPPVESQPILLGQAVSDQFSDIGTVKEYTFDLLAPADLFFKEIRGSYEFYDFLRWTLIDPDGQVLFQRVLVQFANWSSPSTYPLSRLGTYRVLVTKGAGLEVPFEFLVNQSVIQVRDIVLDEIVGPDTGSHGAGLTEVPGEVDRYRFSANAGDTVYFRQIPNLDQCAGIVWQVTQPDGSGLFSEYMTDNCSGGLSTPLRTLTQTGTYVVSAYSPIGGTGSHSFQVMRSTTPQQFDLSLGTRVAFDEPGPGAGFIDVGGTYDEFIVIVPNYGFYVLEDRGSKDSLMVATLEPDMDFALPLVVDVLDRASSGLVELYPGRYRIRVRSSDPLRSGRYRFRLVRNVEPVAVADTITVNRSRSVTFPKARLMQNDYDPDEDRISFSYLPSYSDNGGLVEDLGKRIRYTAPAGFQGVDTFMYGITDDRGLSGYAPVSIVVP